MKSLFKLVVLLVVAVIAMATNPDKESHQKNWAESYKKSHPVAGALGGGKLLSSVFEYQSYYVVSICKTEKSGVQTLGAFGNVFVLGDLTKELPELDEIKDDKKKAAKDIKKEVNLD